LAETRLDFTAVWNDTVSLLNQHKDAAFAIAGVFIFLPAWLFAYYIGEPNIDGIENIEVFLNVYIEFFNENSLAIIASSLATMFGTLAYYIILSRTDITSIGDALKKTLTIIPMFFVVNLITGFATGIGSMLFIIPALYLMGRFSAVAGVVATEPERGIIGSLKYGWLLTHNVGWMAFLLIFVIVIVGGIISFVINLVFALILGFIGGTIEKLLITGVSSLLSTILSVVLASLAIAIYRHLRPQVDDKADQISRTSATIKE